jgi:hypothetical protein
MSKEVVFADLTRIGDGSGQPEAAGTPASNPVKDRQRPPRNR